jgi:hypothetical protein
MITNYKQIIQDLSGIAYHHPQINSFGYGDITQITMDIETKREPVYTKMYVVPGQTVFNQNRIDYNFSIIILDRIEDDYSNQKDVMSDTLEICKDLFTILYQSYTSDFGGFSIFYEPLWGPNVSPFLERFETILGGWTLNITLEQPFDYNYCVLPIVDLNLPASTNLVTYKQVIEDLEEIADKHLQINSFGFGDITQLTMNIETEKEPLYTRMYVIPTDTILNRNELTYNFQIIIADRLEDDYSNQRDVMNDTLEICKDVFTVLYLSEYESVWGATCEPFLENYETVLAGWTLNLTLTQPFDYNRCVLPERPFIPNRRWFELSELWNQISQNWKNV